MTICMITIFINYNVPIDVDTRFTTNGQDI